MSPKKTAQTLKTSKRKYRDYKMMVFMKLGHVYSSYYSTLLLFADKNYRSPNDGDTAKEEICLYWLEKIHAVNKQLQREEELLLSLHAKVVVHDRIDAVNTCHVTTD